MHTRPIVRQVWPGLSSEFLTSLAFGPSIRRGMAGPQPPVDMHGLSSLLVFMATLLLAKWLGS